MKHAGSLDALFEKHIPEAIIDKKLHAGPSKSQHLLHQMIKELFPNENIILDLREFSLSFIISARVIALYLYQYVRLLG